MTSIFQAPTSVDETLWGQYVRITLVPVTADMRVDPLMEIPPLATWAIIGVDREHRIHQIGSDADEVRSVVWRARQMATRYGAQFDEPAGTCEYCGRPTGGQRYCPTRDCELLNGGRETSWWRDYPRRDGLLAPYGGLVAS